MINLKLHQCYEPFISISPIPHCDKSNKEYYRAWFRTDKSEKKGFAVREDFYSKWAAHEIAEMNVILTEKGASLINYDTFEDFEAKENRRFIETTGIYLDGTYIIDNPNTGEKEKTTFIPAFPNRFSFNYTQGYNIVGAKKRFLSFNLKSYTGRQVRRYLGLYNDDLDRDKVKEFHDEVTYYYVISKHDYEYIYDGNEYGSWVVDSLTRNFSLLFNSRQGLFDAITSTSLATSNQIDEILKLLLVQEELLEKQISYAKAIKKVAQTQLTKLIKVELRPHLNTYIKDVKTKIMLSNLEGIKFEKDLLGMGMEFESFNGEFEANNLGKKLDNSYDEEDQGHHDEILCDISLYVIAQV